MRVENVGETLPNLQKKEMRLEVEPAVTGDQRPHSGAQVSYLGFLGDESLQVLWKIGG